MVIALCQAVHSNIESHGSDWCKTTYPAKNRQHRAQDSPKKKATSHPWEVFTSLIFLTSHCPPHISLFFSQSAQVHRLKLFAFTECPPRFISSSLLSPRLGPGTPFSAAQSHVTPHPHPPPLPHIPGTLRAAPIWSALSLPSPAAMAVVIERWVSETKAQRLSFLNARSLAWNVVQGLVGNQAGQRREGGGCIRPLCHSFIG